jgi:hypothetical protein
LQGHVSTLPEDRPGKNNKPVVIKVGPNGIAADKNFEWLYFGPGLAPQAVLGVSCRWPHFILNRA